MKKLFFIAFLLIPLKLNANSVEMPSCKNDVLLSKAYKVIENNISKDQDIASYRKNKLTLKNLEKIQEIENVDKKDNLKLVDALLMLKINEGVEHYKFCKANKIYLLIYQIENFNFVNLYNENKEIGRFQIN